MDSKCFYWWKAGNPNAKGLAVIFKTNTKGLLTSVIPGQLNTEHQRQCRNQHQKEEIFLISHTDFESNKCHSSKCITEFTDFHSKFTCKFIILFPKENETKQNDSLAKLQRRLAFSICLEYHYYKIKSDW